MESEDDEWELCNDDGFVYKRKRRRLNPPPPPPEADQEAAAAEKRRKERKRQTLLKLKAKYEKEILQWESLSNTLRTMQISATHHQLQQPQQNQTPLSLPSSSSSSSTDSALLNDLLSQVEAQEAVIHDISNLCDVAEEMCSKREEQFKQSLFDLPIWASPLDLMQVLCDEMID